MLLEKCWNSQSRETFFLIDTPILVILTDFFQRKSFLLLILNYFSCLFLEIGSIVRYEGIWLQRFLE